MAGISMKMSYQDAPARMLIGDVIAKTEDMTPAMQVVGEIVRSSSVRNFEAGGRPTVWQVSKRARKEGGQTLIKSGRLRKSITIKAGRMDVVIGTNVVYARIHQLGGEITRKPYSGSVRLRTDAKGNLLRQEGRPNLAVFARRDHKRMVTKEFKSEGYTIKMPRREFLLIQEEDWMEIRAALAEHFSFTG